MVSYNFSKENGWGFGNNTTYFSYRQHISLKDIRQMEKEISEKNGYKKVVIMNWKFI